MIGKRVNPRLVKLHRSYSVEELALKLGRHKNSIRKWIKDGLPTIDNTRPILMEGSDVRQWLTEKRKTAKRPCPSGMIFCFKCRDPKPPALGMLEYTPMNAKSGNLSALCECGTVMYQRVRKDAIVTRMPNLDIQIREAQASIIERTPASLNCDKTKD